MSLFTSQFEVLVEKATSENLVAASEDIELNLQVCDQIKSKKTPAKEAIRVLKRRIAHKNPNVVLLALKLTDMCAKNCGHHFLLELASRDFIDTLATVVRTQGLPEPIKSKGLQMVQSWAAGCRGRSDLANITDIYGTLRREGYVFPPLDKTDIPVMLDTETAPTWSYTNNCVCCGIGFTLSNRQHHCRKCGQSVCNSCSPHKMPLPQFGIEEEVRICRNCFSKSNNDPLLGSASTGQSSSAQGHHVQFVPEEDDDLKRAIEASLKEANASKSTPKSTPKTTPKSTSRPAVRDEETDADLAAAIAASLRESNPPARTSDYSSSGYGTYGSYGGSNGIINNNSSSSSSSSIYGVYPTFSTTPAAVAEPNSSVYPQPYYTPSAPIVVSPAAVAPAIPRAASPAPAVAAYASLAPAAASAPVSAATKKTSTSSHSAAKKETAKHKVVVTQVVSEELPTLASIKLSEVEQDNIDLFSELVDRWARSNMPVEPQVQLLYNQLGPILNKLDSLLEDLESHQKKFTTIQDKLNMAVRVYDHHLEERMAAVSGVGRNAAPPTHRSVSPVNPGYGGYSDDQGRMLAGGYGQPGVPAPAPQGLYAPPQHAAAANNGVPGAYFPPPPSGPQQPGNGFESYPQQQAPLHGNVPFNAPLPQGQAPGPIPLNQQQQQQQQQAYQPQNVFLGGPQDQRFVQQQQPQQFGQQQPQNQNQNQPQPQQHQLQLPNQPTQFQQQQQQQPQQQPFGVNPPAQVNNPFQPNYEPTLPPPNQQQPPYQQPYQQPNQQQPYGNQNPAINQGGSGFYQPPPNAGFQGGAFPGQQQQFGAPSYPVQQQPQQPPKEEAPLIEF